LYLGGMCLMLWNVVMTIRQGQVKAVPVLAVNPAHA
jgi:cytochrome c oxidase cbb3-type subunit I